MRIDANGNIIKTEKSSSRGHQRRSNRGSLASLKDNKNNDDGPQSGSQKFKWRNDTQSSSRQASPSTTGPIDALATFLGIHGHSIQIPGLRDPVQTIYLVLLASSGLLLGWRVIFAVAILFVICKHNER